MSPPPEGRRKDGSVNRTPSRALSPWSPAAPRNSISASRRHCRTRRPVPCNRRPWARSPLPGGLEREARGLWKDSGRPQVPGKPSFHRQRVRRDCACEPPCSPVYCVVPRPEATTALDGVRPHLGPELASPSSRDLRGRHRAGGRRTCGDMYALDSCVISARLSCRHLKGSRHCHYPPQVSLRL